MIKLILGIVTLVIVISVALFLLRLAFGLIILIITGIVVLILSILEKIKEAFKEGDIK